jgi:PAS domain S-box-containing protein
VFGDVTRARGIVRSVATSGAGVDEWSRQVIDCTSYAVIVADENGVIRVWNESAQTLLGYTPAEAIGRSVDLIIPERFRAAHGACFAAATDGGRGFSRTHESTVPAIRRDGLTIQIRGNLSVLQSDRGAISGAALIVRRADAAGADEPGA